MRIDEIEKRMSEIALEVEAENADLDALEAETRTLKEEKKNLKAETEKRNAVRAAVASGIEEVQVVSTVEVKEQARMDYNSKSPEYKSAWLKTMLGQQLTEVEQRAYTHTTANTGAVVPEETLNAIYSNMAEKHPIIGDVKTLRSGTVLRIAKHTAVVAGAAAVTAEGVAPTDEQNTFVNVTLSGETISKAVEYSYQLGYMAIPAFETYLTTEVADSIGSALAAQIVANVKAGTAAANKINVATAGTLVIADVLKALGLMKEVGNVVIYSSRADFYGKIAAMGDSYLKFLPTLQGGVPATLLGNTVKQEDAVAANELIFLDPAQFTQNEIAPITVERDKDIKRGVHVLAGHYVGDGTLTNDKAAVVLTIGTGI